MSTNRVYWFKIDAAHTPATMPMERLAEYMAYYAKLLGEQADVHFGGVKKGSIVLGAKVPIQFTRKVEDRARQARDGQGPTEAVQGYRKLNAMLKEDVGKGEMIRGQKAVIINFPGSEDVESVIYGSFSQEGSLDGTIERVGGITEEPHVLLKSERGVLSCVTTRDMCKLLRDHLYEKPVRIFGAGRWLRNEDGTWELKSFRVRSFQPLDDAPLSEVVKKLRETQGSEWSSMEDPWEELKRIRHGADGTT